MERRRQERLIGAAIMVALAVAVVPELLSGPSAEAPPAASPQFPAGAPQPVRNVTVDLATSKPPLPSADPVPAPAPPPPPTATPASLAPPSEAQPAASPPASPLASPREPPPLETAAAPPISKQSFAVQLGSFANRSNAAHLVHQLKAQGYAVYELSEGAGGAARYRVRVGPLSDRDSAQSIMAKLKSQGHDSTLIAPR